MVIRMSSLTTIIIFFVLFVLSACDSKDSSIPRGSEKGRCYSDNTCNSGLVCISGYCVNPDAGTSDDDKKSDDDNTDITENGAISYGSNKDAGEYSASYDGAEIVIDDEGSPVDGLKIIIPEGAFLTEKTITISFSDIHSYNLNEEAKILSPLIRIGNCEGYALKMMQIQVPVTHADDEAVFAYAYNDKTGNIRPLTSFESEGYLVIPTMTFDDRDAKEFETYSILSDASLSFFLLTLKTAQLKVIIASSKPVDSGFRPMVDNWEFVNKGSVLSPGGNCAAMCATSQWYYQTTKEKTDAQLYGLFGSSLDHQCGWMNHGVIVMFPRCSLLMPVL